MTKVNYLKDHNLYPFFSPIEASEGTQVMVKGKQQIMIGSNNYLGLTHHPEVIEAAIKAIEKFGTGCTGSRFLNGNLVIHEELEEKLAKFLGHEKAIVFATGMQTNLGTLSSVCGPKDCMIFDGENHASLIDGARLAFGTTFKYRHNDMNSLEEVLESNKHRFNRMMIVADGVFSMTGEIVNLPAIVALAKKYDSLIYIDDAHGLGVLGPQGRGTIHHFDMTSDVHLNMGTFSKSFASIGGVISGKKEIIDFVKHTARSFMFSAAMPPSAVATVSKCIDVVQKDPSIHENLWRNVDFIRKGFKDIGLFTYKSETPIIPVYIGDDIKAMEVTRFLHQEGVFCTPVISPAVPKGEALIRTSYMASHKLHELEYVLEKFKLAKKICDIPSTRH